MASENKRKYQRIRSLNLSYICLDENNNIVKQGMGRTLNISESGILLETHFPIESEYSVLLTIALKEDLLEFIRERKQAGDTIVSPRPGRKKQRVKPVASATKVPRKKKKTGKKPTRAVQEDIKFDQSVQSYHLLVLED